MKRKIKIADLPEFDIAEHLDSCAALGAKLTVTTAA